MPVAAALVVATLPSLAAASPASAAAPAVVAAAPVATAAEPDPVVARLASALPGFRLDRTREVNVAARSYAASRIAVPEARTALAQAPTSIEVADGAEPARLSLLAPDGTSVVFAVSEDSVMEPGLQALHPELRTYVGTGVTDPDDTIRLSITPLGLSASVRSVQGNRTWYVDPAYYGRGVTSHLSYLRGAVPAPARFDEGEVEGLDAAAAGRATTARRAGEAVTQRTYRMAWVTTPSYAEDFGTANVMAEKVKTINRANHIYMDDMAIKFVLAEGSDALNLDTLEKATGPNGPCGANPCLAADEIASCGGDLNRVNFVTGQIIGADRYDIGHIGSGEGGGGVARLAAVGGEFKSSGCTSLDEPRGDFYAIDFFAHEVGHQMGGNHTFDGNNGSCMAPNRNAETSVEPGSGSTVMAYAGICTSDDLQPHTDPYFSQRTIDEFTAVTTAEPTLLSEQQVVNLTDFAGTDSFQLSYSGNPVKQTITNGTTYTVAGLEAALLALTGKAVQVSGYDGASALDTDGFTLDWPDTADAQRVVLENVNGATGFVGVTIQGGPTGNQGIATVTANRRPVVSAGEDKLIPIRTPFVLTGTATDAETGQQAGLTYLWEQNDAGLPGDPLLGTGPGSFLSSTLRLAGPLFRVFGTFADVSAEDTLLYESPGENLADGNPSRSFPDLAQVLADNTNAEGGSCPVAADPTAPMEGATLDCYSELLPDALFALSPLAGELNFRLTVRDGSPLGGGTGFDDVVLTPDPTVGPFAATSRATAGTPATAGGKETVTWDVAGTDSEDFATTVKISISTDGGLTFPHVVAAATPNDGTEEITLPGINTTRARIKVEAVGNYFYDTNDADFVIEGGVDPVVPQTTITAGVERRGFVASKRAGYAFESSVAGSTFVCTLDTVTVPCDEEGAGGVAVLRNLKAGTHVFTVQATGPDGQVDPTPARREFAVVGDQSALERGRGWSLAKKADYYGGSALTTSTKGRVLSLEIDRMSRYAVLVAKSKGQGRIAVLLNGKRVRTIDLGASTAQSKVLVTSKSYAQPQAGTLVLRSLDDKRVVVDGVGTFVIPAKG